MESETIGPFTWDDTSSWPFLYFTGILTPNSASTNNRFPPQKIINSTANVSNYYRSKNKKDNGYSRLKKEEAIKIQFACGPAAVSWKIKRHSRQWKLGLQRCKERKRKAKIKPPFTKSFFFKSLQCIWITFLKYGYWYKDLLGTILFCKTKNNERKGNYGSYFEDYINDMQYE